MQLNLLGVNTTSQTFDDAMNTLAEWAGEHQKRYICTCPVFTLMSARENPQVMQALNQADMVTADGMPIVWLQRRRGNPQAERVYGPDIMQVLCSRELRHYFYGGLPGVANQLEEKLRIQYSELEIAGKFSPPVATFDGQVDFVEVERLNATQADIIWVGLGSPKQDLWMMTYRPHLDAPLLIGVGAAFDFLAGTKKQAPRWMQRYGLEWLYRLIKEPRRLWKRYLVYNIRFIFEVIRDQMRNK